MTNKERTAWLEARRLGIGGSDVGAIIGVNSYRTPLDVYLDKTGQAPLETEESAPMYWGNVLEEVVAQEFAKRTGKTIRRRNSSFVHGEFGFLRANIDRYIVGEKSILECKTAGEFTKGDWGEDGTDEIPFAYLVQIYHYMTVTNYHRAYCAVLIGGRDYRIYDIPYRRETADKLVARCSDFWHNHVIPRVPPEPVNQDDLSSLFPAHVDKAVTATDEIANMIGHYNELKTQAKDYDETLEKLKFEIQKFMGEAGALVDIHGATLATWRSAKSSRLDTSTLKMAEPEIYKKYLKEASCRRFLVK